MEAEKPNLLEYATRQEPSRMATWRALLWAHTIVSYATVSPIILWSAMRSPGFFEGPAIVGAVGLAPLLVPIFVLGFFIKLISDPVFPQLGPACFVAVYTAAFIIVFRLLRRTKRNGFSSSV
jgi:hypothetical protein